MLHRVRLSSLRWAQTCTTGKGDCLVLQAYNIANRAPFAVLQLCNLPLWLKRRNAFQVAFASFGVHDEGADCFSKC